MSTLPPDGPDYGQTPPSGGNYGGYGGYGQTPPPPPSFDKPVPGGSDWAVGDALAYGWKKFVENLGQILLASLILLIGTAIAVAVSVVFQAVLTHSASTHITSDGRLVYDEASGRLTSLFVGGLSQFVLSVIIMIISAAILRGALDITEGRAFQVSGLLNRINLGNAVVAGLLVGVITAVAGLFFYLPGIVAWFFLLFTPFFVVDKDLGAVDAVKASFEFTKNNLSNMLVWVIVGGIVYAIGICLCGLGLLVTAPVVLIGAAYTYKKLTGQPVAP